MIDGGLGRDIQDRDNLLGGIRGDLGHDGQPAVDVALEAQHVGGAGLNFLAGWFGSRLVWEEVPEAVVDPTAWNHISAYI